MNHLPFNTDVNRILFISGLAIGCHLLVLFIKLIRNTISNKLRKKARPKWRSVSSLAMSILVFAIYFVALGKILHELGISLTTYLASASVIGLAVAFGSQGIVQDVVTGITLVFSDLLDIDDLVEIAGKTGYVETIGMRFIVLRDANKAKIYIPNRTVSSVLNYSKGHINYVMDITLPDDDKIREQIHLIAENMVTTIQQQTPAVFIGKCVIQKNRKTSSGKEYTRIIFKIWPGRQAVIDGNFKPELLNRIREIKPDYPDWMVLVSSEIE